jgi:hypothetical protein
VQLAIFPERSGARAAGLAATLSVPPLGLGAEVGPARWTDRFSPEELSTGDEAFDARFRVRGSRPAQLCALLTPAVRQGLLALREARLDDEGALVAAREPAGDGAALARFLSTVQALGRALDESMAALPLPEELLCHEAAWRALALRLRGRLEPGTGWIRDGRYAMEPVSLGPVGGGAGDPAGLLLIMVLDPPRAASIDPDDPAEAAQLPDDARALLGALPAGARRRAIGPADLRVELAAVPSPERIEPLLHVLARLCQVLRAGSDLGPYR